jgi:hypothetical protein
MEGIKAAENSCSILNSILPAARSVAVLLGFDRGPWESAYASVQFDNATYTIVRKSLPNNFARVDVLFVNNCPAGSLVFVEIAPSVFHMVGMFISDELRGKKVTYVSKGEEVTGSIAFYFLQHVMDDLVTNNITVTLEVMNYNEAAYRLYEKWNLCQFGLNKSLCFTLCSKQEITRYSKIRSKRVGKWHLVGDDINKFGVQWTHVPDYNGESTYSISRVYCSSPEALPKHNIFMSIKMSLRMIVSSLKYGSVIAFFRYSIASRRDKNN